MHKVLVVGEMLADIMVMYPEIADFQNDTKLVDRITITTGGDACNNSIDFAALGNSVTYIGRISTDVIGQYLTSQMESRGIDMSHAVYTDTPQTKMNILVNPSGDRSFFYYPGSSAELTVDDLDFGVLDGCEAVQVGSAFHMPLFDGNGSAKLFAEARKRGALTSMDITSDFSGKWNEIIEPCYPVLDYFLPSIEQAGKVAGTSDEREIAKFFLDRGVKNVVIKMGSRGCLCANKNESFMLDTFRVPVRETTGAGDAFVAAFITAALDGYSFEKCAVFGSASSAMVIQEIGATTGIKSFDELKDFVSSTEQLKRTDVDL